jgi:hypothetical protein
MDRSPSSLLPFLTIITGFVSHRIEHGLLHRSMESYKQNLEQWAEYAGHRRSAFSSVIYAASIKADKSSLDLT